MCKDSRRMFWSCTPYPSGGHATHPHLKENSLPFLVARWIDRHDGLLKSAATEQQLLDVLSRPYIAEATIPSLREGLARIAAAELVPIAERIAACRDPTDDKFLELAVNGHADLIVTGDRDLAGAQSVPSCVTSLPAGKPKLATANRIGRR
jgi:putative PIN family toxin of toxin-antitoxin system